jgi:hypothetical protein
MKKILLFCFIILFVFRTFSYSQNFKKVDTVLVFHVSNNIGGKTIESYIPYKKDSKIHWMDNQNIEHKSIVNDMNSGFLTLNSSKVYPSEINILFIKSQTGPIPTFREQPYSILHDSSNKFSIMSYYDFTVLLKELAITIAHNNNDPIYKNISPEEYKAAIERKKQRRREMFAALDTCPLHYGIKTNLVRDLTNEINVSFELPVKRNLCIDFGVGILYAKNRSRFDFATVLSAMREGALWSNSYYIFDHSFYNRKGFTLEAISKFFLSKKKHLYLGPQLCFRYFYYDNRWSYVNENGSDYYRRISWALQSERSSSVQCNAIFGVQTPQIKKFIFDAFISFGFMYRGGSVTRSIYKTYLHEGTHTEYYDPPEKFKGGNFSLSGQVGFRMGWRFGKAKLH